MNRGKFSLNDCSMPCICHQCYAQTCFLQARESGCLESVLLNPYLILLCLLLWQQ